MTIRPTPIRIDPRRRIAGAEALGAKTARRERTTNRVAEGVNWHGQQQWIWNADAGLYREH